MESPISIIDKKFRPLLGKAIELVSGREQEKTVRFAGEVKYVVSGVKKKLIWGTIAEKPTIDSTFLLFSDPDSKEPIAPADKLNLRIIGEMKESDVGKKWPKEDPLNRIYGTAFNLSLAKIREKLLTSFDNPDPNLRKMWVLSIANDIDPNSLNKLGLKEGDLYKDHAVEKEKEAVRAQEVLEQASPTEREFVENVPGFETNPIEAVSLLVPERQIRTGIQASVKPYDEVLFDEEFVKS